LLREETDITNRAAFKQAEAQVAVANQALAASKKSALPKVSFYGRYAYQLQVKPGKESQQVNFDVGSLGLRLDVPLFAGKYYKLQSTKEQRPIPACKVAAGTSGTLSSTRANNMANKLQRSRKQTTTANKKIKIRSRKLADSTAKL
jgi:hypothetical protein